MENNRQKKVSALLLEELSILMRKQIANNSKILVTLTDIKVTSDLSIAKVYFSIFPSEFRQAFMKEMEERKAFIRGELGKSLAKNLRQIPQLQFYNDDSLDLVDKIEKELKGEGDNPIL